MITVLSNASTKTQFLPREPLTVRPRHGSWVLPGQPRYVKIEQNLHALTFDQLQLIARSFVLRREASLLSHYLPPKCMHFVALVLSSADPDYKDEYVVFVSPTELQLSMMGKLLHPENLHSFASSTAKSLALIGVLSKLCNSPYLLKRNGDGSKEHGMKSALEILPAKSSPEDVSLSGMLTHSPIHFH